MPVKARAGNAVIGIRRKITAEILRAIGNVFRQSNAGALTDVIRGKPVFVPLFVCGKRSVSGRETAACAITVRAAIIVCALRIIVVRIIIRR